MKKVSWSVLVIIALLPACQSEQNVLSEAEKAAGWELLFDGQTLNGWRDYNGTGITAPWVVEDGTLAALGKGSDTDGYIVTNKQYENFELVFDWKISKGGNGGLLYHVVESPQNQVPYVTGPEFQVIDNEGYPEKLEGLNMACADYAMHVADPAKTKLKPAGQWNNSKIVFDNGHVEHWLNGEKVVEFEAWSDDWFERKNSGKWEDASEYGLAHRGVFSLQDHGDRSWYRNMKVRELPRKTKEVELFNGKDLHGWEEYGTEKWYVEDGVLICESGPDKEYGYLSTREYYNDFDLSVDFKQGDNGNSGIFIRSFIPEGTTISGGAGWQIEVAPPGQDTGGIYESFGREWLYQIPEEKENILKMGEWNTMRIRAQGDRVTTWLNGVEMVNAKDDKIGKSQGRISLQIHSVGKGDLIKVSWKNLKLKQL